MSGGEGATVSNVPLRNTRNTDARLPRVVSRTWADIANSFNGLKGARSIEKMLQRIADEGIPDSDSDGGEEDPRFDSLSSTEKKEYGEEDEDGGPKSSICQKIKKLIEEWMVDSPVDK